MSIRYHCEFENCVCRMYAHYIGETCKVCKHGKIWHSRNEAPPSDKFLQFYSIRKSARKPQYSNINNYVCKNNFFCATVDDLPA